jgi:aminoglycoside phosphotransferase (APT) family kinase protein
MPLATPEDIPVRLSAFLARETGSQVRVEGVRPLAGGASRAAYALDIAVEGGPRSGRYPCVLRLDLGGKIQEMALGRLAEFEVLRRVKDAGVLVPRVYWAADDPAVLGRDFLVLERIEGETLGKRIVDRPELDGARRLLPRQMGRELARIHGVDPSALGFLPRPRAGEPPALADLRRARAELDKIGEPRLALEIGWRWLREQRS